MIKKERETVTVDEVEIKKMIAGDLPPYLMKEEDMKMNRPPRNGNEPESGKGIGVKEKKEDNSVDNLKVKGKRKTRDNYRETFLQQPRPAASRQTTLNMDEKSHAAIKKMLKIADGLSMAGFVNNVLRYHFQVYKEDINELRCNYIADLYKEEEEGL